MRLYAGVTYRIIVMYEFQDFFKMCFCTTTIELRNDNYTDCTVLTLWVGARGHVRLDRWTADLVRAQGFPACCFCVLDPALKALNGTYRRLNHLQPATVIV